MKYYLLIVSIILFFVFVRPVDAQSISVSGTLPPKESDFSLQFQSLMHSDIVSQNATVPYQLTYGSKLYYISPLTVQVSWGQGQISGSSETIDMVDYVPGSATTAYGGTQPIIDEVNKTLTWNIQSFPSQTLNQVVNFSLQTNDNYKGTSLATFATYASLINNDTTEQSQMLQQQYSYNPALEPTLSVDGIIPTYLTPTSAATHPTPTITLSSPNNGEGLQITNFHLLTLSSSKIGLLIQTNKSSNIKVQYGTSTKELNQTLTDSSLNTVHEIALTNLQANTKYYITGYANDSQNSSKLSEIYVFKTAQPSTPPRIDKNAISVSSNYSLLYDPSLVSTTASSAAVIVIPKNQPLKYIFTFKKSDRVKQVQLILRNKYVLGASTSRYQGSLTEDSIDLIEIAENKYAGIISTPTVPGVYEMYVRISDAYGNITEQKVSEIKISKSLTVFTSKNHKPVEHAQVLYFYYDFKTQQYEMLPQQLFPIKNPDYTDNTGQLITSLPQGKYMVLVRAPGYKEKEVYFILGSGDGEEYPQIALDEEPLTIGTLVTYYWTIFSDTAAQLKADILSLSASHHFFELNALLASSLLVLLTFFTFLLRLCIPFHSLIAFLHHQGKLANLKKEKVKQISGSIRDKHTSSAVSDASIFIIYNNKTVFSTKTNSSGGFQLLVLPYTEYTFSVFKDGYQPVTFSQSDLKEQTNGEYMIEIESSKENNFFIKQISLLKNVAGFCFEILLTVSLFFELALGYTIGWSHIWLFLLFSIANVLLWVTILSHNHIIKKVYFT